MIEVRALSKHYNRGEGTNALRDLSFRVREGSIFGVLGNEGAGKTTLLRILSTLILPSEGGATIGGHSIIREREKVKILTGYVPHNPQFHRNLTVAKYLNFWARVDGLSGRVRKRRVAELVDFFDLGDTTGESVLGLSTSAQARLFLAEALLSDPQVLLVDEPLTSLSPEDATTLSRRLRDLKKEGKTILVTASRLRDVQDLSDEALILEGGRATEARKTADLLSAIGAARHARVFVEAEGFPSKVLSALKEHPDVIQVRETEVTLIVFVNPGKDISEDIRRAFREEGVEVKQIKRAEIPLSDSFRSLVGRKAR